MVSNPKSQLKTGPCLAEKQRKSELSMHHTEKKPFRQYHIS